MWGWGWDLGRSRRSPLAASESGPIIGTGQGSPVSLLLWGECCQWIRPGSEDWATHFCLITASQSSHLLKKEAWMRVLLCLSIDPHPPICFFWPLCPPFFLSVSSLQDMVTKYQKRKNKL